MASSSSSSPAKLDRKRPRLGSEIPADDAKVFVNHPTLYCEDGNVILKCGRTLFCIHRSLLSRHSTVFGDLLTPREGQKREFLRGLPLVILDDDRDDIEAFLKVIYDGMRVDCPNLTIETFPTLSAILRMSTKYGVEIPRQEILAKLREEWPSSLDKHDAKYAAFRLRINGQGQQNDPPLPVDDAIIHPAVVISLLRQCNYSDPDLLAPLFYDLSIRTWQFGGAAVGNNVSSLSSADTERLIVGVEMLRNCFTMFSRVPFNVLCAQHAQGPPPNCLQGSARFWDVCVPYLGQTGVIGLRDRIKLCMPIETIGDLVKIADQGLRQLGVCPQCAKAIETVWSASRKVIWEKIAVYFELGVGAP
ncbi:hypothetical protein JAAARDRAFT_194768 [Jaapia argillacea MUCL 33604]|uniref:BTB domain-containing protein n=1 Tax=Jaapia argillacea MUCL 33604 TaxID=933084 RepID=A0A067PPV1_9AGAM|nr:hypothetical protein JAAARDRAFT_194768 [Jaapia argillacea MUCL 33604]